MVKRQKGWSSALEQCDASAATGGCSTATLEKTDALFYCRCSASSSAETGHQVTWAYPTGGGAYAFRC